MSVQMETQHTEVTDLNPQIAVIGGGIAGLWLLAELKAAGYQVILCEKNTLGQGQSIASQGIIHGGSKYALHGALSQASLSIAEMPALWRQALKGEIAPNLSHVPIHSSHQYLWTSTALSSRMTGFFASKAMRSRMDKVPSSAWPKLFRHTDYHGTLYRLDEPVLDIPALLKQLQQQLASSLIHTPVLELVERPIKASASGNTETTSIGYAIKAQTPTGQTLHINAEHIVCTAGEGNEDLAIRFAAKVPAMQRRPLQMILLRGDLPALYAHALGASALPEITITSHYDQQGRCIWYIGGQPAEKGVDMDAHELIQKTRRILQQRLPWLDLSNTQGSTWAVNRAEGLQSGYKRPDKPIWQRYANVTLAWPTKLAFAPLLSAELLAMLRSIAVSPQSSDLLAKASLNHLMASYPIPPVAQAIWDREDLVWN